MPDQSPPRAAYLLVQGVVTDPEGFKAYNAALPPIYAKFGGAHVSLTPAARVQVIEGDAEGRSIVISKFPSKEVALAFWNSPEYTAAKALRAGKGHFFVTLLEGLPGT